MIKLIMTWAARFASLNLLRLMGLPFGLIIRIFMGIYNALKHICQMKLKYHMR
jgi:hypothetical protein